MWHLCEAFTIDLCIIAHTNNFSHKEGSVYSNLRKLSDWWQRNCHAIQGMDLPRRKSIKWPAVVKHREVVMVFALHRDYLSDSIEGLNYVILLGLPVTTEDFAISHHPVTLRHLMQQLTTKGYSWSESELHLATILDLCRGHMGQVLHASLRSLTLRC